MFESLLSLLKKTMFYVWPNVSCLAWWKLAMGLKARGGCWLLRADFPSLGNPIPCTVCWGCSNGLRPPPELHHFLCAHRELLARRLCLFLNLRFLSPQILHVSVCQKRLKTHQHHVHNDLTVSAQHTVLQWGWWSQRACSQIPVINMSLMLPDDFESILILLLNCCTRTSFKRGLISLSSLSVGRRAIDAAFFIPCVFPLV